MSSLRKGSGSSSPSPVWHFSHLNTGAGMQFSPQVLKHPCFLKVILVEELEWVVSHTERQKCSCVFQQLHQVLPTDFSVFYMNELFTIRIFFGITRIDFYAGGNRKHKSKWKWLRKKNLSAWGVKRNSGVGRKCLGQEPKQGSWEWRENKGIINTNKTSIWQNDLLFWLGVLNKALKPGSDLNSPITKMNKN